MRTSRPDGISQENRTHPFFILLRNAARQQDELSVKLVKRFVIQASVSIGATLILWLINPLSVIGSAIAIEYLIFQIIYWLYRLRSLKKLLAMSCVNEVNAMIYSNDYQYQSLNNEQLINTLNDARQLIGEFEEFHRSYKSDAIKTGFFFAIIMTAMIYIRIMI